ncbi:hypothetical protein [Algoriphagus formosus]|uniref:hypothetical protein n=1 Tax=Algoriphagus formosus TaxID=2007308 RepID=UPI003F6F294A
MNIWSELIEKYFMLLSGRYLKFVISNPISQDYPSGNFGYAAFPKAALDISLFKRRSQDTSKCKSPDLPAFGRLVLISIKSPDFLAIQILLDQLFAKLETAF